MTQQLRWLWLVLVTVIAAFGARPAFAQPVIVVDYSLDTNNFFGAVGSPQRLVFETAATRLTSRLSDTLTAITPDANNTWSATFTHPGTGGAASLANLTIPQNVIRVYVGGQDLPGNTLGFGGPGGFNIPGANSQTFVDAIVGRGQPGALGANASRTDFGAWGGSISFDSVGPNWNFSLAAPTGSQADFLSVAEHELGHVLGIGTSPSWRNRIPTNSTTFTGPASTALNGGVNPSVTADGAHWADGTTYLGQAVAMDPTITLGTRVEFTELDYAGLADIGWQVTPVPEPATVLGLAAVALVGLRRGRRAFARTLSA